MGWRTSPAIAVIIATEKRRYWVKGRGGCCYALSLCLWGGAQRRETFASALVYADSGPRYAEPWSIPGCHLAMMRRGLDRVDIVFRSGQYMCGTLLV